MEEYLEQDDLGVSKEQVEAMIQPVEAGDYAAKFHSLRKNEIEDVETGEKKFLGYVHSTKSSGKKKVVPLFMLISDDPAINNRPVSAHVITTNRLFAQLDKQLDLMTGTRIDADKVEAAKDKVVTLRLSLDPEQEDEVTGRIYEEKNSIKAILPFKE